MIKSRYIAVLLAIAVAVVSWLWKADASPSVAEGDEICYVDATNRGESNCDEVVPVNAFNDKAGVITEVPQVPQTIPVRRVIATSSSGAGFSVSRIARWCYNLTIDLLAEATDRLLRSRSDVGSYVMMGAVAPHYYTKSCEYYVYALRMIII